MWLALIAAAFLLLVYVGRQSRLGRLRPGPWIRQFRAARSLINVVLCFALVLTATSLIFRKALLEQFRERLERLEERTIARATVAALKKLQPK